MEFSADTVPDKLANYRVPILDDMLLNTVTQIA